MAGPARTDNKLDVTDMQLAALDLLPDGVYIVDCDRRVLYWNKAAEQLTGFTSEQIIGRHCSECLAHIDAKGRSLCEMHCPLKNAMEKGGEQDTHMFIHHADGHCLPVHVRTAALHDADGRLVGSVEFFSDDAEYNTTRKRLRELEEVSLIDELTKLANRRYFNQMMEAALAGFARHQASFGLLLIDIDHFKQFNDTYGHQTGDRALHLIARTLAGNCRAYDTPARWGGEEFAIIAEQTSMETLRMVAERFRALIAASSLDSGGDELSVTVSIGGSIAQPGDDIDSLFQRADQCLYQAKQNGRNRVVL